MPVSEVAFGAVNSQTPCDASNGKEISLEFLSTCEIGIGFLSVFVYHT